MATRLTLVVVATCALLTISASPAASSRAKIISNNIKHENTQGERLLRVPEADPEDEERGIFPSLKSIPTNMANSTKTSYWARVGYSADDVQKKFGLTGLTGEKLTSHRNYPAFLRFGAKKQAQVYKDMLLKDTPAETVWKQLKLDKMKADERKKPLALKWDEYYAQRLDDQMFSRYLSHKPLVTAEKSSADEMAVRINLWVEREYGKEFAKKMLGLGKTGQETPEKLKYYQQWVAANKAYWH